MTGYRVADQEQPPDPLAIDPERCRAQMFRQRLLLHGLAVLVTAGLWLPGLIVWLFLASGRIDAAMAGYGARIGGGRLEIGNALSLRTVPLDAITGVTVNDGYVTVALRGGQPAQIFGMADPIAASRAILDARDAHVRTVRADVLEAEDEIEASASRGARR